MKNSLGILLSATLLLNSCSDSNAPACSSLQTGYSELPAGKRVFSYQKADRKDEKIAAALDLITKCYTIHPTQNIKHPIKLFDVRFIGDNYFYIFTVDGIDDAIVIFEASPSGEIKAGYQTSFINLRYQ